VGKAELYFAESTPSHVSLRPIPGSPRYILISPRSSIAFVTICVEQHTRCRFYYDQVFDLIPSFWQFALWLGHIREHKSYHSHAVPAAKYTTCSPKPPCGHICSEHHADSSQCSGQVQIHQQGHGHGSFLYPFSRITQRHLDRPRRQRTSPTI
jgi:hypothetical protein